MKALEMLTKAIDIRTKLFGKNDSDAVRLTKLISKLIF